MANPMYGQNKNDDALDLVNSSNGDVLQIASNPARQIGTREAAN